jgi:transketolase C-terminal domain/subunit
MAPVIEKGGLKVLSVDRLVLITEEHQLIGGAGSYIRRRLKGEDHVQKVHSC